MAFTIDRFMSNNDWAQEHTTMWRYVHGPGTIYMHNRKAPSERYELIVDVWGTDPYSGFFYTLEEAVKLHKVMTRLETPA